MTASIAEKHFQAQMVAAQAVNPQLILRHWLIGVYIIEFEQSGEDMAKYGARLILEEFTT